ncbi:hypothetical protein GW915_05095 [bacterium]|nr:hypothetical protein [bacterium]
MSLKLIASFALTCQFSYAVDSTKPSATPASNAQICNINYSRYGSIAGNQVILELLQEGPVISLYRGSKTDLEELQKALSNIEDSSYNDPVIQDLIAKQMSIEDSARIRATLEHTNAANLALASRPHFLRRSVPFAKPRSIEVADLPRRRTPEELNQIEDIFKDANLRKYIDQKYRGKIGEDPYTKSLMSIDELTQGQELTDAHLDALIALRKKVSSFKKKSNYFEINGRLEIYVNTQIRDFLVENKDKILKEFKANAHRNNKGLTLHLPILKPDGQFGINVIALENSSDFHRILESYENKIEMFEKMDSELVEHAVEYMQLRHVVDQFKTFYETKATSAQKATTHRGTLDPPETTTPTMESMYRWYSQNFSESSAHIPSPGYMNYARLRMSENRAGYFVANHWKTLLKITAPTLTIGGATLYGTRGLTYISNNMTERRDKRNLFNTEYWIKKCTTFKKEAITFFEGQKGEETALGQIRNCLADYKKLLYANYNETLNKTRKHDPNYSDERAEEELFKIITQWNLVSEPAIKRGSDAVRMDLITAINQETYEAEVYVEANFATVKKKQEIEAERIAQNPNAPLVAAADVKLSQAFEEQLIKLISSTDKVISTGKAKLEKNQIYQKSNTEIRALYQIQDSEVPKPTDPVEVVAAKNEALEKKKEIMEAEIAEIAPYIDALKAQEVVVITQLGKFKRDLEAVKSESEREGIRTIIKDTESQLIKIQGELQPLASKNKELVSIIFRNDLDPGGNNIPSATNNPAPAVKP